MIQLSNITKTYADGTRALGGVELELDRGMLGLLGPNGAGKTTLLSILVLALEPTSGERRYDGLDAARAADRREIRRRIGYLPQDFAPLPDACGYEYLLHCARLRGVPLGKAALRRRVEQLLEAVALDGAARRPAGEYSGGMKRRLGIAQALIHNPRLLVVDEPTAGLDPEERMRFRNLICDVAEHTAVLLSTHIVEDIEATCPRIAAIAAGRKLFDGPPGELLQWAEGRLWVVPEEAPVPPGAQRVHRRVLAGAPVQVLLAEAPPAGAEPRAPTLEEAYTAFLATRGAEAAGGAAS